MARHASTVNIHCGRKLSGKSKEQILEAVIQFFGLAHIKCVQQNLDVIRVTFRSDEHASNALRDSGIRLFGIWCRMDGGPPSTIVHLFDYPFQDDNEEVKVFFEQYGVVKNVRLQKYLTRSEVYTGTRLVDVVLSEAPPRIVNINGSMCRVWYKGQPLICNLCGTPGHRSSNCPNKDKCRLCGAEGHFARSCPNPWGTLGPQAAPAGSGASAPTVSSGASASNSGNVSVVPEAATPPVVGASAPSGPNLPLEGVSVPSSADTAGTAGVAEQGSAPSIESSPDIGEFTSSASSGVSISDFSQDSQSILANFVQIPNCTVSSNAAKEKDSVNNSNVGNNSHGTLNNDTVVNNIVVNNDIVVDNDTDRDSIAEIEIGGGVVLTGDSDSPGADNEDSSSMDTSGASSKRKSDGDDGGVSGDCVFAKPSRPSRPRSSSQDGTQAKKMRSVSASPSGRHSGLPAVSPRRPKRV